MDNEQSLACPNVLHDGEICGLTLKIVSVGRRVQRRLYSDFIREFTITVVCTREPLRPAESAGSSSAWQDRTESSGPPSITRLDAS